MNPSHAGFTLIELILVMVMVSALAVFAAPRLAPDAFRQEGFHRELANALRYARTTASASGCRVEFSTVGNGYALNYQSGGGSQSCGSGTFDDPLPHPSRGGPFSGSAPGGAAIVSGGSVVFDGRGGAESGLLLTLNDGRELRVEAVTGYVHE